MVFSEVREYQFGDDTRTIDWNVTARYGHPYIKLFDEERGQEIMLVIDVSASMYYGEGNYSKIEKSIELLATLAFSAAANHDKIGAIFIGERIERYFPPKKDRRHIYSIIDALIELKPRGKKTNLNEALLFLNGIKSKRLYCFLISDFRDEALVSKELIYCSKKHSLLAIKMQSNSERKLNIKGIHCIENPETGERIWVNGFSKLMAKIINQEFNGHDKLVSDYFKKLNIPLVSIESHDETLAPLLQLFLEKR
jgi:uncharacterized protein (DUF58 family)